MALQQALTGQAHVTVALASQPGERVQSDAHHSASALLHVDLIAQDNKREVFLICWICLVHSKEDSGQPEFASVTNKRVLLREGTGRAETSHTGLRRQGNNLNEKLIPPVVQVVESLLTVHVIHEHAAVCPTVESNPKALKAFLPCCVPYLRVAQSLSQHVQTRKPVTVQHNQWQEALTCIVTSLSSTCTSFVRKSAPMVALY